MIFTASFPVPPAPRVQAVVRHTVERDASVVSPGTFRYLALAFALVFMVAGTAVVLPLA